MQQIKLTGTVVLFACFAYEDIRRRKIPVRWFAAGYMSAALGLIFLRELPLWEYLAGGCAGIPFLYFSMVSDHMGAGDGALIMLLGLFLGVRHQMGVVLLAALICAAAAGLLCVLGKAKKESRLPFAPFLFSAFLMLQL